MLNYQRVSKSGTCPKMTKSASQTARSPPYESVPQECLPELIETRGCMQKACPTWDAEVTCWMRQMWPGTLWLCQNSYGKSPFFMGKFTISMVIFNGYVKLPEGTWPHHLCFLWFFPLLGPSLAILNISRCTDLFKDDQIKVFDLHDVVSRT